MIRTVSRFIKKPQFVFILLLIVMLPLAYFESFRWFIPPPKATHGFLKGIALLLAGLSILFHKKLLSRQKVQERLFVFLFVLSFFVSAMFSMVPGASVLFLWYPVISAIILHIFSVVRLEKIQLTIIIIISLLLITSTFAFAFFSLMFRYEVTDLYYFLFLPHRANLLLGELRQAGKYVSLGPYIMLVPLCMTFLIGKSSVIRKSLSVFIYGIAVLTSVISNNRIDVLVLLIQTLIILWIIPRRVAVLVLLIIIPMTWLGLVTTQRYFGFNLEERILRPHKTRDIETIEIRFLYWQNALRNFRLHPLFGTGPNSYNEVTDFPLRRYYDAGTYEYTVRQDVGIGVHNIFLERLSDTGIFGFITFLLLLWYFAKTDLLAILNKKGDERKKYMLFSLSSWTWILYGITDNGYGAQGFVTFFFLRGLLKHV